MKLKLNIEIGPNTFKHEARYQDLGFYLYLRWIELEDIGGWAWQAFSIKDDSALSPPQRLYPGGTLAVDGIGTCWTIGADNAAREDLGKTVIIWFQASPT